jgi:hypothetical protein
MPAVPGPSRLIGDGNRSFARVGIGRWVDVRDRVRLFFLHLQHEERTRATGGPRKVSMLAHRGPTDIVVVEARMNGSYAGSQENSHAVRLRNHPVALHRSLPAPVFRGPCVFVALVSSWPSNFCVLRIPCRAAPPAWYGEMTPVGASFCQLLLIFNGLLVPSVRRIMRRIWGAGHLTGNQYTNSGQQSRLRSRSDRVYTEPDGPGCSQTPPFTTPRPSLPPADRRGSC